MAEQGMKAVSLFVTSLSNINLLAIWLGLIYVELGACLWVGDNLCCCCFVDHLLFLRKKV